MTSSPDDNYWIDKIDDPFAKGLTGTLWGLGTRFVGTSFDYFRDRQGVTAAAKSYADKYRSRYGKIRLLKMSHEIDLESVYTAVKFLDKLSLQNSFGSITAIEDNYRDLGKRRFQTEESQTVSGSEVANKYQYLYVLANPGAGKSTFLRRVGLEAIKGKAGKYQHSVIPVMLELKNFNKENVDLTNLIAAITEELSYFGFPDKEDVTEELLKQGKLLLLFDGLDEVPNAYRNSIQNAISNLLTKYSQNRFILSCRIAAYKSPMLNFTNVELADFDDSQIEKFINNWFVRELEVGEECWQALKQTENKAAKELAQTPLLLTFLCLVYHDNYSFPKQRSQLYEEMLDILLRKWDSYRRIRRDEIYKDWNINLEKTLLANIAYDFFKEDRLFFSKSEIIEYITHFLADTVDNVKYLDGEAVLDAITIQQGIFVERATGVYSFSHLTLQEYLTAQQIGDDDRLIANLVTDYLTDERWKEVFLLVAGIKNNADRLLKLMEAAAGKLINTPKLKDLLQWVARIANSQDTDLTYLGKRALSLANAYTYANAIADVYAKAKAKAYAIANFDVYAIANVDAIAIDPVYTIAIDHAITHPITIKQFLKYVRWSEKWQIYQNINYVKLIQELETFEQTIPDKRESKEVQNFVRSLLKTWFAAFDTTPEAMTLSEEEIEILNNYLYASYLIIQCKEAATRVTDTAWKEIESRMLLPADEAN